MEWNLEPRRLEPRHLEPRRLTKSSLSKDADTPNYSLAVLRLISELFVDETYQIKATKTKQLSHQDPPNQTHITNVP